MKAAAFGLQVAHDGAEAMALLRDAGPNGKPLAGGQSLRPMLNLRLARPSVLVELSRAADLRGAADEGDAIRYGAAVTHAEIEDGDVPDATPGWMAAVAARIAYRAVRSRGTIGGSLAHADPAADWLVTLTALGATAIVDGPRGRRNAPMPGFIAGPFATSLEAGEILAAIRVPKTAPGACWGYWKFTRKLGEFAKASAAVLLADAPGRSRIALGALERPPILLPGPDALLADPTGAEAAIAAALPGRDPATLDLHVVAVHRAIAAARARA